MAQNFGTVSVTPAGGFPTTIAASGNWTSPVIQSGFGSVLAACKSTQTGAINIQRYADTAGTIPVGAVVTAALSANVAQWANVGDGLPYLSFTVQFTNTGASTATITGAAILTGPLG